MDQDPFDGHRGNVLSAFFRKFTPNYVIKVLTDYINKKKNLVYELMSIIHRDDSLSIEEKKAMGLDIEKYRSDKITEKGIEYKLLKKNLIIKKV